MTYSIRQMIEIMGEQFPSLLNTILERLPVIVAGEDFGCGSSREHAVWAIRGVKVQTVIAKTFARIFYRNAINNGFYIIESPGALEKINDGDEVEIDYKAGLIKNKTAGIDISFNPLPDFALEIINDGGLLEHVIKIKS